MTHVLVGVDGSPESERAAHLAATIARGTGRGLIFAHVLPSIGSLPGRLEVASGQLDREVHARGYLESLSQRESSWGCEAATELLAGSPAEVLADRAREDDVDLVVVGHRGRGAVARVLLGSVADRLVQISPKPALVVR